MKRLLTLLAIFCVLCASAQNAQMIDIMRHQQIGTRNVQNITPNQIEYWIGTGSNACIAVFFFCQNGAPQGVAYGIRWNGTLTVNDLLDSVATDSRFDYDAANGLINSVEYNDDTYSLLISYGMLTYTINDVWASGLSDDINNGDYFVLSEWSYDCDNYPDNAIFMVPDPNSATAEDATIDADDVTYWVGNGDSKVVFAVNWARPGAEPVAKAWGVRFDNDSALVADIMNTIRIYDNRFDYTTGSWSINNIYFNDGNDSLSLVGDYWMYNVNGMTAMYGYDSQYVIDGDIIKWGDESCGTMDESYNFTWETPIQPVSLPNELNLTFDGIVGSSDCQAIRYDDVSIIGWATGCTIQRGPQNIESNPTLATYGSESDAIGASSTSTIEAVSLGDGGIATLTFSTPISNGDGYDFAVFENSLNNTFLELAFVEVSSDGEHFYRFPSVSNIPTTTQIDNGGSADATLIHNLAGKYCVGYGTPFDLAELDGYSNLDINNITHVRLVDVIGSINPEVGTTDKNGHLINDPYPTDFASCGFDLTGVSVMNGWTPSVGVNDFAAQTNISVFPNPSNGQFQVILTERQENLYIHDISGKLLTTIPTLGQSVVNINLSNYATGIYLLKSDSQVVKLIIR